NFFADQVLRTMGYKLGTEGSFEEGARIAREWMAEIGAPAADKVTMQDGSGLAYDNIVQPRQFTHVLRHMRRDDPAGNAFRASLSPQRDTEGRVLSKSGYIGQVRTLCGYATTA